MVTDAFDRLTLGHSGGDFHQFMRSWQLRRDAQSTAQRDGLDLARSQVSPRPPCELPLPVPASSPGSIPSHVGGNRTLVRSLQDPPLLRAASPAPAVYWAPSQVERGTCRPAGTWAPAGAYEMTSRTADSMYERRPARKSGSSGRRASSAACMKQATKR